MNDADRKAFEAACNALFAWGYSEQFSRSLWITALEYARGPKNLAHPDDEAVDKFAHAMKEKLALAREKGRSGWKQMDVEDLSAMLREHVEKGDPRDVANFCMFIWHQGVRISAAPPTAQINQQLVGALGDYDMGVLRELAATLKLRSPSRYKALQKLISGAEAALTAAKSGDV